MKKETVILVVVIAFLAGFVSGATVAILKGKKGDQTSQTARPPQKPQMVPQEAPPPPGPPPAEVALKIDGLKEIVKKDPKNLSAWVELGNLYFDTNQPQEAIKAYTEYLKLKPDSADVRTDLGIMYRNTGETDKAIEEFKKAAQIDPKHINSRYNLGLVLLHDKRDMKAAIKAWEDYLKVDPNSERAQRLKAQLEKMKKMGEGTKK
ncbi:MAG: tetratricopeptide repeat protein [Deltaproteobacteria bacterium]|nr:MAG: tetratricopeptide repeat protein [Deltaproteobacteria bacterium]